MGRSKIQARYRRAGRAARTQSTDRSWGIGPVQEPRLAQEDIIDGIRREFGPFDSDDDLVLHIMFHHEQLRKIPPYDRARASEITPSLGDIATLLKSLRDNRGIGYVSVSCKGIDLTVSRSSGKTSGPLGPDREETT